MFGTLGTGGASGVSTRARNVRVAANSTGIVYTVRRLLGSTSTISLTAATNANLSLDGDNIEAESGIALNETQKAVVREELGDQAVEYAVNVTGIPALVDLTISPDTVVNGVETEIDIVGAAAGSTITGAVPAGLTLNSGSRTITGTPSASGTYEITLVETLAGAIGSPRVSTITLTVETVEPPAAMTIDTITPGPGSLTLGVTEGAAGDAPITDHRIYLSFDGIDFFLFDTRAPATEHELTGLAGYGEVHIYVTALNIGGEGPHSNVVSGTPGATAPLAGTLSLEPGVGEIIARPTSGDDGGSPVTQRVFYIGDTAGTLVRQTPTTVGAEYPFLYAGGTTKYFAFADINIVGEGALSNIVSETSLSSATIPGAFTGPMWDLDNVGDGTSLRAVINGYPSANGSEINDIEYSLDGGVTEISSGGIVDFDIGSLATSVPQNTVIRAVNGVGPGPWSDVKTRAPEVAVDGMRLGMGLAGVSSFSRAIPFRNILWTAANWSKDEPSMSGTISRGFVTGTTGYSDTFYRLIKKDTVATALKTGTYHVLQLTEGPKASLRVNVSGQPNGAWYTSDFTFEVVGGQNQVMLNLRGDLTHQIAIVHADDLAAYLAGGADKEFTPEFIEAIQACNLTGPLRMMDWLGTNGNFIREWSQRTALTDNARSFGMMPYEIVIDACNLLGLDLWLNIPGMASNDYVANLIALIKTRLDPALKVHVELHNEIWNNGDAFLMNTLWFTYADYTRYNTPRVEGEDAYYLEGHGFADLDPVAVWYGPAQNGTYNMVLRVIDENKFRFQRSGSPNPASGTGNAVFVRTNEAGKSPNHNGNIGYAVRSMEIWALFDDEVDGLGRARVIHEMGSMLTNSSGVAKQRVQQPGALAALDHLSVAPYNRTYYVWGNCVDVSDGAMTLKSWLGFPGSGSAARTIKALVYEPGSVPTTRQLINGTGAGFVATRDIAVPASPADFVAGTAITGLDNTKAYEVFFVYESRWVAHKSITPNSTRTEGVMEDFKDHLYRSRSHLWGTIVKALDDNIALIGDKPLSLYEGNKDDQTSAEMPPLMEQYIAEMVDSDVGSDYFMEILKACATRNVDVACWFTDLTANWYGVFDLFSSYLDYDSPRQQKLAAFNGVVPRDQALIVANPSDITLNSAPGSYPHLLLTMPDDSLTYRFAGSNVDGYFAWLGNQLYLTGDVGLNWSIVNDIALSCDAYSDNSGANFSVRCLLGGSWASPYSVFVFDAEEDADTAALNPIVGGTLALTGTAATYDSTNKMWNFNAAGRYSNTSTATSATVSKSLPLFIAMVLDKDDQNEGFTRTVARFGNVTNSVVFERTGANLLRARWVDNDAGFNVAMNCHSAMPSGKLVAWTFRAADGRIYAGYNSSGANHTSSSLYLGSSTAFPREVSIGGTSSSTESRMKHGSIVIVSQADLDLTSVLLHVATLEAKELA